MNFLFYMKLQRLGKRHAMKKQCNQTYYNLNYFLLQYLYLVCNLSISQVFSAATFSPNSYEVDKEAENATCKRKVYFNNGKYHISISSQPCCCH